MIQISVQQIQSGCKPSDTQIPYSQFKSRCASVRTLRSQSAGFQRSPRSSKGLSCDDANILHISFPCFNLGRRKEHAQKPYKHWVAHCGPATLCHRDRPYLRTCRRISDKSGAGRFALGRCGGNVYRWSYDRGKRALDHSTTFVSPDLQKVAILFCCK